MNTQKSPLGIFLSILIIVAVLLAGIYFYYIGKGYITKDTSSTSTTSETANSTNTWKVYRNEKYGFEMKYPPNTDMSVEARASQDVDGIDPSAMLAFTFPNEFYKGTNLLAVTVFAGAKQASQKECTEVLGGSIQSEKFTHNSEVFTIGASKEGAAGSSYDTLRYSIVHNGLCYQVTMVARSFNDVTGYNELHPDIPVVQFDTKKLDAMFTQIFETFTFLPEDKG